jgi:hypothetical protein
LVFNGAVENLWKTTLNQLKHIARLLDDLPLSGLFQRSRF